MFIMHYEQLKLLRTAQCVLCSPMCQTLSRQLNGRQRQGACARSCCIQPGSKGLTTIHSGTTKWVQIWIRFYRQSANFRKKWI